MEVLLERALAGRASVPPGRRRGGPAGRLHVRTRGPANRAPGGGRPSPDGYRAGPRGNFDLLSDSLLPDTVNFEGATRFRSWIACARNGGRSRESARCLRPHPCSLYEVALDNARWPATTTLIEEAIGASGSTWSSARGLATTRASTSRGSCTAARATRDRVREYFDLYHAHDERPPRLRQLPHGKLGFMAPTSIPKTS